MLASSGHPALPAANRPIFNPGLRLRSCARRALNEQPSRDFWSIFSHLCVGFMLNCLFLSTLTGGHLPSDPNHFLGQAESSDFYQGFCALGQRNPSFSCWRPKYSEEVTAASGSVTACPARPSLPLCPPRQPLRTAITGEQCEAQPPPFPSTAGRCSCSFLLGRAHQNKMRRRMNDDDTAQAYTNTNCHFDKCI